MAASSKHKPTPLPERISKARREGRTQQALELSKELAKQEPTAEHKQLLRDVIFERGCQLLRDGKERDASVVFQNALAAECPPEFRAAIAGKLAELGDVATALAIFEQVPESEARGKAFAQAVDSAVAKGAAGKNELPPDLHAAFDAVIAAFAAVEQGNDDAARDLLQAIGLSSPFLEWKVMLRGLIAYYQNDNARALDNWQRLNAERKPWRLVAPFRMEIDPAFRDAQPEATRVRLQRLLDSISGSGFVQPLRALEKYFVSWRDEKTARAAIDGAASIFRALREKHPKAAARLAHLVYTRIAFEGLPNEAKKFASHFGLPPDDPKGNRLRALMGDHDEEGPAGAIEGWYDYAADLENLTDRFPGEENRLARALVWERLGVLMIAASDIYREMPKEMPLSTECFRKCIALAPNRVTPHVLLLAELQGDDTKRKQAIAAAKKLVAEFPDHARTWQYLGDCSLEDEDADAAIEAYRNALKANPMDRGLRRKLSASIWAKGMAAAKPVARSKKAPAPENYRPQLEEALRMTEGNTIPRLAAWAILERRLGHDEFAAKLLSDAPQRVHQRIALPLSLHIAAQMDKKLAAELRDECKARWEEAIAQRPTADEIVAGLEAILHFDSKAMRGKKDYVAFLLPKANDKALEAYSEEHLLKFGRLLLDMKLGPKAKEIAAHGAHRFKTNPSFLLLEFDAVNNNKSSSVYRLRRLLESASKLAVNLPREKKENILAEIKKREDLLPEDRSFLNMFQSLGAMFGRSPFGDDFDDDDDLDDGFF